MANTFLTDRDRQLLQILDFTPATATQLLRASVRMTDPFTNLKYLRRRLQKLVEYHVVRVFRYATQQPGALQYYKLTRQGHRFLHGPNATLPPRSVFEAVSPSLQEHTSLLSDVVIRTLEATVHERVELISYQRENSILLRQDGKSRKPDGTMQLAVGKRRYNFFLELDLGTEVLCSVQQRKTIEGMFKFYDSTQEFHLNRWAKRQSFSLPPRFRVLVFSRSRRRLEQMLLLAKRVATRPDRHVVYGIYLQDFIQGDRCLRVPIALNHHGRWRSLVEFNPKSPLTRPPVDLKSLTKTLQFPQSLVGY